MEPELDNCETGNPDAANELTGRQKLVVLEYLREQAVRERQFWHDIPLPPCSENGMGLLLRLRPPEYFNDLMQGLRRC